MALLKHSHAGIDGIHHVETIFSNKERPASFFYFNCKIYLESHHRSIHGHMCMPKIFVAWTEPSILTAGSEVKM